jgi:hypothetical protein
MVLYLRVSYAELNGVNYEMAYAVFLRSPQSLFSFSETETVTGSHGCITISNICTEALF